MYVAVMILKFRATDNMLMIRRSGRVDDTKWVLYEDTPRSAWSQVSIDCARTLVVAFVPLAACTILLVIYERLSRCLVASTVSQP